jgi:hypothetical protein
MTEVTLHVNMGVGWKMALSSEVVARRAMNTKRTHVVLSERLVKDIDRLVGSRQRSSFLTEAAEKELMRRRQIEALKSAAGAWNDGDHPELKQGSANWVRNLRQEGEGRVQRITRS